MVIKEKRWLPLHIVISAYCLFTILLSLSPEVELVNGWAFYLPKLTILTIVATWPWWVKHLPEKGLDFLNAILGVGFLGFFYNETGQLNHLLFEPIDPYLVNIESWLFGVQPSLLFSAKFPNVWITELMNLGYLSYYFIIVGFVMMALYHKPEQFNRLLFLISQSFIIYYFIFILIPSWGPQFYFQAPANHANEGVFFQKIIAFIQHQGETATGAIPSSHVGITAMIVLLSFRHFRHYFWFILPFALLLFCSTVYIKAHYLIDVIAGFISAPLILLLSQKIWNTLNKPTLR